MKLTINSHTDTKHHLERRGGREFLVTQMKPISGDTVMNQLYYPMATVAASYGQLDKLPAPAGHPEFENMSVSALDPEGASAYSVGAFVRNPVVNGKDIYTDLVIDTEVANRSDKGKQIINRIQAGERIGVSTGLNGNVESRSGYVGNEQYHGVLNSIRFDHVALLLDEAPAGNTFTINQQELSMRTVEINTEALSLEDHSILLNAAKHPKDLVTAITTEATQEVAEKIVTNSGKFICNGSEKEYSDFIANRDHLAQWMDSLATKRKEKVSFIIDNTEMVEADLAQLSDDAIDNLVNSVKPKNVHIANFSNGGVAELDLSALEA